MERTIGEGDLNPHQFGGGSGGGGSGILIAQIDIFLSVRPLSVLKIVILRRAPHCIARSGGRCFTTAAAAVVVVVVGLLPRPRLFLTFYLFSWLNLNDDLSATKLPMMMFLGTS